MFGFIEARYNHGCTSKCVSHLLQDGSYRFVRYECHCQDFEDPNGSQPRTDIVSRFVSKDSFSTQAEDSLPLGCCMSLLQRHFVFRWVLEIYVGVAYKNFMRLIDMTKNDRSSVNNDEATHFFPLENWRLSPLTAREPESWEELRDEGRCNLH